VLKYDYINLEHKYIVDKFIEECILSVHETSNKKRFGDYMDFLEVILKYHNEYSKKNEGRGHLDDYLNIIPHNLLCCTTGYLIAIETKTTSSKIGALKQRVMNASHTCMENISKIRIETE